jgi:hypothetical protein
MKEIIFKYFKLWFIIKIIGYALFFILVAIDTIFLKIKKG